MKKIIAVLILFYSIANFSQSDKKQEDTNIYTMDVDVKPEFPEGLEKLNSYINGNVQKAESEKQTKAKTKKNVKSIATFVVEKDGSLSDIKIYGKIDSLKSKEVIRILKSLPKWNPGKQNGKIVRVHYSIPLTP